MCQPSKLSSSSSSKHYGPCPLTLAMVASSHSWTTLSILQPQGLCTCCSLYLKYRGSLVITFKYLFQCPLLRLQPLLSLPPLHPALAFATAQGKGLGSILFAVVSFVLTRDLGSPPSHPQSYSRRTK